MRVLVVLALLALGACTDTGDGDQTLRVLAAASLTGSFDELAEMFEAEHPGVEVQAVYDSSATLATQVSEGAPADVLATADLETMQKVLDAGDADASTSFAGNTAVLVTPAGHPSGLDTFDDLDGSRYVVCVEAAPCGKVAATLLERNGVRTAPVSFEDNVKAVLQKVISNEADAGIVYRTDALAAGDDVLTMPIPGAADVVTEYAIAVVEQSENVELAQEFVDLLVSDKGQRVLRRAGFQAP